MAINFILRVTIFICVFLVGLFATLATTGKKYEEKEDFRVYYDGPTEKTEYYAGL